MSAFRTGRIFALLEPVVFIELAVCQLEVNAWMASEWGGIAVIPSAVHVDQIPEVFCRGYRITRNDHVADTGLVQEKLACISKDAAVSSVILEALICCSLARKSGG